MDENLLDKNGNPIELQPKANRARQGNYYQKWLDSNKQKFEPTPEDIKCELQLQALDFWEPLKFNINLHKFNSEIKAYDDKWVPYLRREGIVNNREGLSLVGIEGDDYNDGLSMPEARKRHGKKLKEVDFNTPNELYKDLTSLHEMLDFFMPLGRTMLVKANAGGWFPPHKDAPQLTRDTFRIVAFLSYETGPNAYEWEMCGQKMQIIPGQAYYVDTRKTHRTHAWIDNSIHLIVNVPKTWENVIKLMSATEYF